MRKVDPILSERNSVDVRGRQEKQSIDIKEIHNSIRKRRKEESLPALPMLPMLRGQEMVLSIDSRKKSVAEIRH